MQLYANGNPSRIGWITAPMQAKRLCVFTWDIRH